jgi:hypothetical protein
MKCVRKDSSCAGVVEEFIIWQRHTPQAASVTLCEHHAEPLQEFANDGEDTEIPMRNRIPMEVTKLRKVKETEHLKK